METLARFMVPFCDQLPPTLITAQSVERVIQITQNFSSTVANNTFCFECHLGKFLAPVDYSLHFSRDHGGREKLLHVAVSHPASEQLKTVSQWQSIFTFADLWGHHTSELYDNADHVWLEFDLDKENPLIVPIPAFFYFAASPMYQKSNLVDQLANRTSEQMKIIQHAARVFIDQEELPHIFTQLSHCLEHIPSQAQINQVGFGLTRNHHSIRLQLIGIHPHQIPDYLTSIGWNYPITPLDPILDYMNSLPVDVLALSFDVGDCIFPKVGIECYLDRHDQRWDLFLMKLVDEHLCLEQNRENIFDYSGIRMCQKEDHISMTQQRFSHIKIGYQPEKKEEFLEAKAYLFHYPHWVEYC